MPTLLEVELGAHQAAREAIEALLSGSIGEEGLLQGILDSVADLLSDLAQDPTVPRLLGVEVMATPGLVEIRIPRGRVVDTLLCPLA
jgi:hypothetical protein